MNPNNGEIYAMANSTSYNPESPRDDKNLLKKYSQSQINNMSEKQKTKAFNEIWKNPIVPMRLNQDPLISHLLWQQDWKKES